MHRFIAILTAACLATPALADWSQITSKKALSKYVVGKNFVEPKSKAWFQLRPNGKLAGGFQGKDITGNWKWNGKRVCYSRKLGGERLPNDCIILQVDGNKLATTRKSNGSTVLYRRAK